MTNSNLQDVTFQFDRPFPVHTVLVAAGYGSRLGSYTAKTPKCLLSIGGQPLISHTLAWLSHFGVRHVRINTHFHGALVQETLATGQTWGVTIKYYDEPQLLGTAASVRTMAEGISSPIILWYGDNLSTCRLDRLWEAHLQNGGIATMALFHRPNPINSGIVLTDHQGRITTFSEKPRPGEVFSHWVNSGIFILEPAFIRAIPGEEPLDLSLDVLPYLIRAGLPLYAYYMGADEGLWWIDTVPDLLRVRDIWGS